MILLITFMREKNLSVEKIYVQVEICKIICTIEAIDTDWHGFTLVVTVTVNVSLSSQRLIMKT